MSISLLISFPIKLSYDLIDGKNGKKVLAIGEKLNIIIAKKLQEKGLKFISIPNEQIIGKYIAKDIKDKSGEILIGAGFDITEDQLESILKQEEKELQIVNIDPINKGETVWTVAAQDLVIIGELFLTGKYNAERIVALAGSCVKAPKYYKTRIGSEVATMIYDSGLNHENVRVISGGVLSGDTISPKQHLGFYHNAVTVIPQGDDYEFFGWNKPVFNKISPSRALTFSWMQPNKEFELNTNTNGEHRAFVVTGNYEEVFPLDIYPLQILKACLVKDLDAMEALGMYEVAPEDFALTEFVCVSKQPHQQIIREGLDLMYKEIG